MKRLTGIPENLKIKGIIVEIKKDFNQKY